MLDAKAAFVCAGWNLKSLLKNPKTYLCAIMAFLLCFLLTDKVITLSREYRTNVQVFEPFIWCFADSDSILFAALVLMLLLTELPRLDAPTAYLIFRTNRMSWLLGQMITIAIVSLGYVLFLLLSSMALCTGTTFLANRWSDTATLLSFAPRTFEVALSIMRKTIKLTTPYSCTLHIGLLMLQYTLFMSALQLMLTVFRSKRVGVTAVLALNIVAYLLTPDRFMAWLELNKYMQYYANLLSAWLSPLQHATFTMHNFGYDLLPTLQMTHGLFGGLSLTMFIVAFILIKRRGIDFSGGSEYE